MKGYPYCLLFLLSVIACQSPPAQHQEATPIQASVLSLPYQFSLDQTSLKGETEILITDDLVRKGRYDYRAFSLRATLAPIVANLTDTSGLDVIFVCSDGYEANIKLSDALQYEGYLAYQPASEARDSGWPTDLKAKYAPYYLVWEGEGVAANKDLTWPYAVTDIRLSKAGEEFLAAMPPDEAHLEGFELFKHTCIKCHTVNKVGGSMGPELNFPRNITEYWQKEDIWAFVQSPQSFRYNSKMPPMPNLEREEFELIYGYLSSMKGQHFGI